MKKKTLSLMSFLILAVFLVGGLGNNVSAMSEKKSAGIAEQCEVIIYNLKQVQKRDAKARVYFGGYYEKILTKFITPLNMRLIENNLSTTEFIESQNSYIGKRANFINDYISYQKNLEELIAIDCKTEPVKFYDKLEITRSSREKVSNDIKKMRESINGYVGLVKNMEGKI